MADRNDKNGSSIQRNGTARNATLADRLYELVEADITSGALHPGQCLPSVRIMAARHGVGRDTVLRAYDKLIARGRVQAVRGSGFYVSRPAPLAPQTPRTVTLPALDPRRLIHSDHPRDRAPGSGILRHGKSEQAELAKVLRHVVASVGGGSDYGDPLGYQPLRQELCGKLCADGIDAPADNIITTPGSVAGLILVVRSLLKSGTWALVEDPSSFIHTSVLMSQGANVARVPRDADGPDLEVLRILCERHRPLLFLLSSILHNPTGTSIAPYKAQKLIEMAAEFGMLLIDDASYADLLPPEARLRSAMPLMLLDRRQNMIHVGGFSHMLAPAVGPGFVVAGERHMQYIRVFRPTQGLGNTVIQERLLYRFLHEGLYRRRCERVRAHLNARALALARLSLNPSIAFPVPAGGIFVWTALGDDVEATAVATRMLARGYLTAPAQHFSPRTENRSYMRFNVTTTTASALHALTGCLQ